MAHAEDLIDLIERKQLLSKDLINQLRMRAAQTMTPIPAEAFAQRLVEKDILSQAIAEGLLREIQEGDTSDSSSSPVSEPLSLDDSEEEEEIGLAPMDDEAAPPSPPPEKKREKPSARKKPADSSSKSASSPRSRPNQEKRRSPPQDASEGSTPPEPLFDESLVEETSEPAAWEEKSRTTRRSRHKRPRRKKNPWDSKLLLIGGGTLILLVIVAAVLVHAISRRSAEEVLSAANEAYLQGSYTQAIAGYRDYLDSFPSHPEVPVAKVRRSLSRMRQVTNAGTDWSEALRVVEEEAAKISGEEPFQSEGRQELKAMLPKIADGLVADAGDSLSSEKVEQTEKAIRLIEKYIPFSSRPAERIRAVEAELALVKRKISRDRSLEQARESIEESLSDPEAIDGETIARCYEQLDGLLREYPMLLEDPRLTEIFRNVSRAERFAIHWSEEAFSGSEPSATPTVPVPRIIFADRVLTAKANVPANEVIFSSFGGVLHTLSAETGDLLWRYPLGTSDRFFGPPPPIHRLGPEENHDVIVIDHHRRSLVRLDGKQGTLVWELPMPGPFHFDPPLQGNTTYLTLESGKLLRSNISEGTLQKGHFVLPQSTPTPATFDPKKNLLYQLADRATMYVIDPENREMVDTIYLGHQPGSVRLPPLRIHDLLIVAEQIDADDSVLKIFSPKTLSEATENGQAGDASSAEEETWELVQTFPIEGIVETPPTVDGNHLLLVSDRGNLYFFTRTGLSDTEPFELTAQGRTAENQSQEESVEMLRYLKMLDRNIWVADYQLTRFDIQSSRQRLIPSQAKYRGTVPLGPLEHLQETLFYSFRQAKLPGATVLALSAAAMEEQWRNRLGVPMVTHLTGAGPDGEMQWLSRTGQMYLIDPSVGGEKRIINDPTISLSIDELNQPLDGMVTLPGNLQAWYSLHGPPRIPVYDPKARSDPFRWITLPAPLAAAPIAYEDGLLTPLENGRITLWNPQTGAKRAEPFAAEIDFQTTPTWTTPLKMKNGGVLVGDGRGKLFHLEIQEDPQPHLALRQSLELSFPLASPMAEGEEHVFASDAGHSLLKLHARDLTLVDSWELASPMDWGPAIVGETLLFTTREGEFFALDMLEEQSPPQLQGIDFKQAPLAGTPIFWRDKWLCASVDGSVWTLEASSGTVELVEALNVPLTGEPVLQGDELFLNGKDGCLYGMMLPNKE